MSKNLILSCLFVCVMSVFAQTGKLARNEKQQEKKKEDLQTAAGHYQLGQYGHYGSHAPEQYYHGSGTSGFGGYSSQGQGYAYTQPMYYQSQGWCGNAGSQGGFGGQILGGYEGHHGQPYESQGYTYPSHGWSSNGMGFGNVGNGNGGFGYSSYSHPMVSYAGQGQYN